jgi:hypothetical protein
MKLIQVCRPRTLAFSILVSCIFVAADAPETQQKDEIRAIGCFTNVQSEGEHDNGYSVQLWSRGRAIIGLINYFCGLEGDLPIGLLTEVQYDSLTGKLSFKAKLTSGLHYCSVHKNVPSHDLLSFQGFLKADSLEGKIVLEDQLDSPPGVVDKRDDFLMRRDNDFLLENYASYEIWWKNWEPVFKRRGPKW